MNKIYTFCLILVYIIVFSIQELVNTNLNIWVLDIGQGDSTLIQTPNDKYILVDTGPSDELFVKLGESLPFWIKHIDVLIISHPHFDHIAEIKDLFIKYDVKKVIWYEVDYFNPIYQWAKEKKLKEPWLFNEYFNTSSINFTSVSLEFVYPETSTERMIENINNASVFFLLRYGNFLGVFTGDSEEYAEEKIVHLLDPTEFSDEKIIYLKAGHHCSNTSSSEEFLDIINADFATCSLGKDNSYGHPGAKTIALFRQKNIKYYRTDIEGTIQISTNGASYDVESENNR